MKVAVIGAGTMGAGIAQTFATAPGYEVLLCDISEELAVLGFKRIEKELAKLVKKGKLSNEAASDILGRVSVGTNECVGDCDLIVEAIIENMEIKRSLFKNLQSVCGPDAIFASNTSSLSLTEMASGLDRPIIGMHFFNPAPVMKLVEVVAGMHTGNELVEKIKSIAEDIGKVPVEVKEGAGFVVNRILVPMINEAVGLYADSTASAGDIDTAMKLGANHPMGPLELGDLIGLDVCLAIMEVLFEETGDPKYRPHPLMRKMVRAGMLGRKTKQGFYNYAN